MIIRVIGYHLNQIRFAVCTNVGTAKVVQGSPPADDGRLLLTAEERINLIQKYPELDKVIKPFIGSREFINDTTYTRYCFW